MVARLAGGKTLPTRLSTQILAKTDGVPLFVEELTKAVLESGLLRDAGGRYELAGPLPPLAIPATLHDSLMARLDRLAPIKVAAQLAAVIGREFSYELLAAASALPDEELKAALRQLVEAGLVLPPRRAASGDYIFKHALVRDAAYASLLKSRRQQLHAQIAEILAARFPEVADTQPEVLAQHCVEAGLIEKAVGYWHKAGELAARRSAMAETATLLRKGLELLPLFPGGPERDRYELDLQITMGVALIATKGQSATETGSAYARARELCQQMDVIPQFFPVLYGRWAFHFTRAELIAAREAAEELLRLAQHHQDIGAQVMGHRVVGTVSFSLGELALAREQFEALSHHYDSAQHRSLAFKYGQDPQVAGSCWLSWTLFILGHLESARSQCGDALNGAHGLSHPATIAQGQFAASFLYQFLDIPSAVREHAEAMVSLANEQGLPIWLSIGTTLRGWAVAAAGEAEIGIGQMSTRAGCLAGHRSRAPRPLLSCSLG